MRNWKKRFLALALSVILTLGLLPGTACAAVGQLLHNSSQQNEALLEALSELAGPEDAREFYALLQEYGLLDEDGQFITDRTIDLNGEEYTLEEMEALLAGPDTDLSQMAEVDGVPITLGDLATVIAIEREIQHLQETYFSGATFEGEALANVNSLLNQLQTQGLTLSAAPRAAGEQVVLSDTGNANVEGYTYHYISTSSPFQPEDDDTFSVKFKLAIPDAIQKMGGDVIVGFRTSLTGTQWLSSQTVAVKDAGSTEYTLTAEGNWSDYRTLYLGVSYQGLAPEVAYPELAINFSDWSFGTLYGGVSFYEPEGFLFGDSSGYQENYNLFFGQTLTMPELVKNWTQPGAETDYEVNSNFATFTIIPSTAPEAYQNLDSTLGYLQSCVDVGEGGLTSDDAIRFQISSDLAITSNSTNDALLSSLGLFAYYTGNMENFTVDTGFSGTSGFPINLTVGGETKNITFSAFRTTAKSEGELSYLPRFLYVLYGSDEETTNTTDTKAVNNTATTTSNTTVTLVDHKTADETKPTLTVTAPAGTYQSGDLIPITITGDEYIQATSNAKITINETEYTLSQLHGSTEGKFISLLYEVKEIDNSGLTISISGITDFFGNPANEVDNISVTPTGGSNITLVSPLLKNAVESFTAEYENGTVVFAITADQAEAYRTEYGNFVNDPTALMQLLVTVDGGTEQVHPVTMGEDPSDVQKLIFTAEPYPVNLTNQAQTVTVQLQVNQGTAETPEWVTVHRVTQEVTVPPLVAVTGVTISVVNEPENYDYTIVLGGEYVPKLQAQITPANASYTSGYWTSSNEDIATIGQDGQITLTGSYGPVSFTYTADNGTEDIADDVTSDSLAFTVTAGDKLTLSIPKYAQNLIVREDAPFTVVWSSNAMGFLQGDAVFTVAITDAESEPVYETTVTNALQLEVPAGTLKADYPQSTYTVTVSLEYLSAQTTLTVLAPPTQMRVAADKASITDSEALPLTFTTTNGATGKVTVTRGADKADVTNTCLTGSANTDSVSDGAVFTFTPEKVTGDALYETYTVTFAENRTVTGGDFVPSSDSLVINVYRSGALSILVNGQEKDTIDLDNTGKVSSLTAENNDAVAAMDSADILALRQELGLIEYVSINADAYSWSSFRDGIEWVSDNPEAVGIYYRKGGLWDNIQDLSYETYLPQTQMAVSSTTDTKNVTITATHAATQMTDSVTVNVDTLRDQFYIFQVSPAQKTALTYTDSAGDTKTVYTNSDGLLALYEPDGIASDVSLRASSDPDGDPDDKEDTNPLLGTIPKSSLVSGERDAAKLQLYPLNTTTLVPAAQAELYLTCPDGTPYANQKVTLRGGVYLEGHYCQTSDGDSVDMGSAGNLSPGNKDITLTTDGDGKLRVSLNATQFNAPGYDGPLTNAALEYWFELRFANDAYFPMLVNIQGTMSADRILRTGSAVVVLEKVPEGQENTPFLTAQTVAYGKTAAEDELQVRNVLGSTGKVGPNSTFQYAQLTSHFMLWGLDTANGEASVSMTGETGAALPEQTVTDETFPFTKIPVMTNTTVLTQATMTDSGWQKAKTPAALRASVYQAGELVRNVPMSFQVVDLTNVKLVDKDAAALVVEMQESFTTQGSDFTFDNNKVGNAFGDDLLNMVNDLQDVGSPMFKVLITPTEDSTVFNALIWGGYNSLDMNEFDYSGDGGVTMDYSLLDTELSVGVPPLNDLSSMAQGTYDPSGDIRTAQTTGSNSGLDIGAQLEGYYEGQFYYDTDQGEWAFRTTGGGMSAGASLSFQANLNAWVGPIPVTATFGAGIALQLEFQAATVYTDQADTSGWSADALKQESVNDYLTTLRINGYVNAFGGFGFDYSILALKIGLYGELAGDSTNTFLSREYLANPGTQLVGGQALGVSGEVGIKFYAKFLFISYETVIGSGRVTYTHKTDGYTYIDEYWNGTGSAGNASAQMGSATLLNRAYLAAYANNSAARWSSETPSFEAEAKVVQNDANPGSEPVVNDDGSLSVYISDRDSDNYFASRIMAGPVGTEGTVINDDGYGDMSPSLSGSDDLNVSSQKAVTVAAWVRLFDELNKGDGEEISPAEQKQLLNSTEIMVATTTDGTTWTTEQLTDNASPDLAPVTAASGTSAIVFWRSVYSSDPGEDGADLMNFDTRDVIYARRYSALSNTWGDPQMVYNGANGGVAGIQAAMLPDGTAIVTFILERDPEKGASSYELAYRTLKPGQYATSTSTLGDLVVLTSDGETDTNPQAAAVSKGGTDYFVLAWYSTQDGGDIRLQAVGADGLLYSGGSQFAVPASVNAMTQEDGLAISPDFRFAKQVPGSGVGGLTLVWPEAVNNQEGVTDHSVLYGVQLCDLDGGIRLSTPQALVTLPDRTLVNSFSAWRAQDATHQINAYIFGTWYDQSETEPVTGSDGTKYTVPLDEDRLLTGGKAMKEGSLTVDTIAVDYANLRTNSYTPVVFTVRNTGATRLTDIEVSIANTYSSSFAGPLDPGESAAITVMYKTGSTIYDENYSITAGGASGAYTTGKLVLNYQDVGISSMKVVREEEGQRDVLVTLYNDSAAKLGTGTNSNRGVELRFYTDAARTKPAQVKLAVPGQTGVTLTTDPETGGSVITLCDRTNMTVQKRIDQGSMTLLVTYDLGDYVTGSLGQTEVPESGVYLYADVQVKDFSKDTLLPDYATGNNQAAVRLTGLYARAGEKVALDVTQDNTGAVTTAEITLTNNSLQELNSGALVASLLDENGQVLESTVLSAAFSSQTGESAVEQPVAFGQKGTRVVVHAAASGEDTLAFDGLNVTIGDFEAETDETGATVSNEYVYTLPGQISSSSVTVTAVSGSGGDVVIDGEIFSGGGSATVAVSGVTEIPVTIGDKTYTLTLTGPGGEEPGGEDPGGEGSGGGGGSSVTQYAVELPEDVANGTVTASPTRAARGRTVTLTVTPHAGYERDALTVTDADGKIIAVTDKGGGRFTFTMPRGNVTVDVSFRPEGSGAGLPFTDVAEGDWYYGAVAYVYENGLMTGTSATIFSPGTATTRAMIATILWRLEGSPVADDPLTFEDVAPDTWYTEAIRWAAGEGIVTGYGGGRFGPDDIITREQLATMLHRYAQYKNYDVSIGEDTNILSYLDVDQLGQWAVPAMQWACGSGLMNGVGGGRLAPLSGATRAEAATLLTRFCQQYGRP